MGTAMVTGASAGLGLEFAWQLATARHDVVLVARDGERLHRLASQLEAAAGVRTEVMVADLSQRDQLEPLVERLRHPIRPVGLLVNNAGFGIAQPFIGGDLAREEVALDVMVRAVLVLSHAAAGVMVERGRGAILNVASIASLLASGTYSAHKAWVRAFTEGLAVELRGTGVTATALCPGLVHTEFHQRGGIDTEAFPSLSFLNPEDVVASALADVRRGAVISTPSLRYKLVAGSARVAPRWAIRAVGRYRRELQDTHREPSDTERAHDERTA
ncbi:MAG: SDR family NAD(P)-dependent oxidoreductase [Cellulomonas sp.]|uniref:SDR family NAD(P)-dependent oxidoreductase n=1 Tax=Cellulomonas sp. 73-92 TaxID=1895740 RepID=UPI00092A1394|nr:SDR family NAD(P)-dependent oxidoreductase [Cellulomonas sp. 73-92]MBN9375306.1 SDR family NAD(P)-dependent oxidoreductase [Cellulomonas sp.]OJV81175.1 MAG: short-chain dehydrogenase [Cellulomonas sp. 73-92]